MRDKRAFDKLYGLLKDPKDIAGMPEPEAMLTRRQTVALGNAIRLLEQTAASLATKAVRTRALLHATAEELRGIK